jgi:rhodanese-related sulfurtransferase
MDKIHSIIIVAIIFGALSGALTASFLGAEKSEQELVRDFYLTETAVHVSPHHLRKAIDKGDDSFVLVDVRSAQEYAVEHIIGAINIPAYKDPDTSAYGDTERIISEFSKLPQDKDIIVYCYSMPCMSGRKIGKLLAENDMYVQQLGVGWNEWRYFWTLWNHEHEWDQTNVEDYIVSGNEQLDDNFVSCPIGEFDC